MLLRAATVVQVLQDLFYVLLHVLFFLWSLLKTSVICGHVYHCRVGWSDKTDRWSQVKSKSSKLRLLWSDQRTRLSTVGDRAFPVVAARIWNNLPQHVTSVCTFDACLLVLPFNYPGWANKNGAALHFPEYLEHYEKHLYDFLHTSMPAYTENG